MKDAYSFHTSKASLDSYYDRMLIGYKKIFASAGIPEVVEVEAANGMMGGDVSHEFMLLCSAGEDTIVICDNCQYKSNMETASIMVDKDDIPNLSLPNGQIYTPNVTTIEQLASFLNISAKNTCKAVVYENNGAIILVFIRGDLEINESKLKNILGLDDLRVALKETTDKYFEAGFIGPMNISKDIAVYVDESLKNVTNIVCGASKKDYHTVGYDFASNPDVQYINISKPKDGSKCPICSQPKLRLHRGIEVGNIFKLGEKYTKSMNMQYQDELGNLNYPIMGCYGIGVGRLIASVCEVRHDEKGPIWPITIAPWQVHICTIRGNEDMRGQK